MLQKLKAAGLLWPTLATLAGVALLLSLGNWQWQRKGWKEGLIATQTARAKAEPILFSSLDSRYRKAPAQLPLPAIEYQRVVLEGRFMHEGERHLYAPLATGPGWQVMTPFVAEGESSTGPTTSLLIDRGFVPDDLRDRGKRAAGLVTADTTWPFLTVTGRIRLAPPKASFAAENDVAGNRWYWRDLKAMWASLPDSSFSAERNRQVQYYIEADPTSTPPGGWPKPGASDAIFNNLSNRHLEYALTWWALAATLLGVFAFFARTKWPRET
jgi:surfeit locus 1 family protein